MEESPAVLDIQPEQQFDEPPSELVEEDNGVLNVQTHSRHQEDAPSPSPQSRETP